MKERRGGRGWDGRRKREEGYALSWRKNIPSICTNASAIVVDQNYRFHAPRKNNKPSAFFHFKKLHSPRYALRVQQQSRRVRAIYRRKTYHPSPRTPLPNPSPHDRAQHRPQQRRKRIYRDRLSSVFGREAVADDGAADLVGSEVWILTREGPGRGRENPAKWVRGDTKVQKGRMKQKGG